MDEIITILHKVNNYGKINKLEEINVLRGATSLNLH
jgi:hypothetical protein